MRTSVSFVIFLVVLACFDRATGQTCTPRSTLPTFCITTSMPVESKDNYVNGSLRVVRDQGTPEELYNGSIRIRGRGNSTWNMAKKPYRINLDVAGSLLGMPATAKNWVLLANYADKTLIRNAVGLEVSRYLQMPYASPFRFVDVILNGDYQGSYLLTDHMEVRENRIDIEEGQDEDVPGAYLAELNVVADQEDFYITTNQGLKASIKYPDLKSPQDQARINDILADINGFESRLFSGNPADGPGGYLERVDLQSLVNWYLGCEITGNPDAFWSVYLHKKRSDERLQKTFAETSDFLWQIRPLSNGFYQIYNTGRNMALTGGNNSGMQLTLSAGDPDDQRQQWRITQTSVGKYAIASRNGEFGVQNKDKSGNDNASVDQIDFREYSNNGIQGWLNASDFRKWTFTIVGDALPVSLTYFRAELDERAIRLDWQVAGQVDGSHFEIERIGNDRQKTTLGTVSLEEKGPGNTYRWTDAEPLPGLNYYRLKMVDKDGSFTYSKIVSAMYNPGKLLLKVYPSPAVRTVSADLFIPSEGYVEVRVYNLAGLMVSGKKERTFQGVNSIALDTEGLLPGLYILKVSHGRSTADARFVVVK
ncbi:MAG: hypothetical protein ABS46_07470 [Cytophagaceae bacterium SCN 52-12]|nr:MAG: hypothetical protein ABS46_07470 [Cytophagaceae bacterium SCN 52-12]